MPRSPHRTGHRYRQARRRMFAEQGDTCWICGHPGAGEADHETPISIDPDQPVSHDGMRPAHGSNAPCPTCGRKCNRERSNSPGPVFAPKVDW